MAWIKQWPASRSYRYWSPTTTRFQIRWAYTRKISRKVTGVVWKIWWIWYDLVWLWWAWRILEVGAGYTTPFLLDGLKANEEIFDEGNLDPSYKKWHESNNDPRLVVIDTDPLPQLDSKYVEHIQGKFQGKSQELFEKYGEFDMIWFDCGGPEEY
jgi:hypothetical protein